MPMPMNSCRAAKEKWKAAANSPSCCGERPKSCCSGGAIMPAAVRKAWLMLKPEISTSSISHALREEGEEVADTEPQDIGRCLVECAARSPPYEHGLHW